VVNAVGWEERKQQQPAGVRRASGVASPPGEPAVGSGKKNSTYPLAARACGARLGGGACRCRFDWSTAAGAFRGHCWVGPGRRACSTNELETGSRVHTTDTHTVHSRWTTVSSLLCHRTFSFFLISLFF
jgi:hypothetical protein